MEACSQNSGSQALRLWRLMSSVIILHLTNPAVIETFEDHTLEPLQVEIEQTAIDEEFDRLAAPTDNMNWAFRSSLHIFQCSKNRLRPSTKETQLHSWKLIG